MVTNYANRPLPPANGLSVLMDDQQMRDAGFIPSNWAQPVKAARRRIRPAAMERLLSGLRGRLLVRTTRPLGSLRQLGGHGIGEWRRSELSR
jgi:hypothetical protein